jgi:integrase
VRYLLGRHEARPWMAARVRMLNHTHLDERDAWVGGWNEAMKEARLRAGLSPASCHTLRHSFATFAEDGYDIQTVQELGRP